MRTCFSIIQNNVCSNCISVKLINISWWIVRVNLQCYCLSIWQCCTWADHQIFFYVSFSIIQQCTILCSMNSLDFVSLLATSVSSGSFLHLALVLLAIGNQWRTTLVFLMLSTTTYSTLLTVASTPLLFVQSVQ